MENTITKMTSKSACKSCKAELPSSSLTCGACGAKNTHPEFLALLISVGLGLFALYTLYQY